MNATKQPLDRAAAWACLMTNLLVLPGAGSWIAGQRVLGAIHVAMSVTGFGLMMFWLIWFVTRWMHDQQLPESLGPYVWLAIVGIALFALAWSWSMIASVVLLRNATPPTTSPKPPQLT